MPAQKKTASSVLGAALGTLGFSALAGVLVTVMVAPAIAVTGMTANNSIGIFESLPDYITLGSQKQQNEIYLTDPQGVPVRIAVIYDQNRQEIPLESMSQFLQDAAVAGEDRRFYEHGGVDLQSTLRAVIGQATGSDESGGASTLSMQTVRNILVQEAYNNDSLSPEEKKAAYEAAIEFSFGRKLQEMKLAISLEKQYSKKEILQGYLNIAGFGANTYGVQAAAMQYFSVNAADVTLAQAASIIAIVQNPSKLSLDNPENFPANQARRDKILGDMLETKKVTKAQYDEAIAIPVDANFIHVSPPQSGCRFAALEYRLFCDYIRKSVPELTMLGATPEERNQNFKNGGYKIFGTLDMAIAPVARATVQQWAPPTEARFQLGAAMATVQPGTGRIIAMAQNKDFDDGMTTADPAVTAVNMTADITHGGSKGFQPGSTYKPFTLLAFLDAGNGVNQTFNAGLLQIPQSKFVDTCNGPWGGPFKFKNDSGENGPYTVMRGTAGSVNSVFLQMATKVDQCAIRDIAASLGVHKAQDPTAQLDTDPSCVIGGCKNNVSPLMMAGAYAAIAAQGVFCKPIAVDKVIGPDGTDLGGQNAECTQALKPEVANTAAYAMAGVMSGTAAASRPRDGTKYIGKTGTTDASVHTWMVGSSTAAATAVWVGNIVGEQALRKINVNGTQAAVLRHRIFRPIAEAIDTRYKGTAFPGPAQALLSGRPTFVPDVSGQSLAGAQDLIERADLVYADGGQIDSDRPAGTIVLTNPSSGTSVPRGTVVTVYTSNGQASPVPDVSSGKNLDFNSARDQVTAAGFGNVSQGCQPGALPTDPDFMKVVAQNPGAGTLANKSTNIELLVHRVNC